MNTDEIITLGKNEIYVCSNGIRTIKCINGIFWITYKGGEDIFLTEKQNFVLKNKKKVLIQALKNGKILIKKDANFNLLSALFIPKKNKSINFWMDLIT